MEGMTPYRTYWIAWAILLVLTVVMVVMEAAGISRAAILLVLIVAMLTKATLIGGWFMHLKFERASLVWPVVIGTLATAAVLFFLLIPDGVAAFRMAESLGR
jgi:caa(3)-type oxidase subunit IV